MADKVKAGKPKNYDGENKFPPHPAGPVMMVITDVVDLGEAVQSYKDNPTYLAPKCAIVLCSGQVSPSGDLWEVGREFTVTTGKKSKLRPFLEAIRGAAYKEQYPDVDLEKLVGYPVYCVVSHVTSETTGYTYANITSIAPMPPGATKPVITAYHRLDRWEKKRQEYADAAATYREEIGAATHKDEDGDPGPQDAGSEEGEQYNDFEDALPF